MIADAGVPKPDDELEAEQLKIQMEFIKQGLHALAEWRTQQAETSRELVIDAVSKLIWHRPRES